MPFPDRPALGCLKITAAVEALTADATLGMSLPLITFAYPGVAIGRISEPYADQEPIRPV